MRRAVPALVMFVFCALAAAPAAHAAFPGKNGKIAFYVETGTDHGIADIFTINPDGTNRTRLTTAEAYEYRPTWSPDGTKLAYVGNGVSTMNADGTNQQTALASGGDPSWSPDGSKIAFDTDRDTPPGGPTLFDIYTMNADGTNETLISNRAPYTDAQPVWSPDGTRIAFVSGRDGNSEIYAMNPDGTNQTRLTTSPAREGHPDWSPDGQKIAFFSDRDGDPEVYTMNADGSNQTRLTTNRASDLFPAFSPDGTKIVFNTTRDHIYDDLYIMNVDGTNQTALTSDGVGSFEPDWQPIPINGYPRPKGATPASTNLTIAYEPCTSSDRQHGPPLAALSCSGPVRTSDYLTVGTLDSNQQKANSAGLVQYDVMPGNLSTPPDEADVKLTVLIRDVRNNDLSDYGGELSVETSRRITDKDNTPTPSGPGAATVQDLPFAATVPCATTTDTTIGSLCSVTTTADTIVPGSVKEGRRSIWELSPIKVYDGGSDGDADTSADNTLFMDEGIFTP